MDRDLLELRRQQQASPEDAELARRYETALRRAGLRDEVDALYRQAFACPLEWGALEGDAFDLVRACQTCRRDVHYVRTREEMARWVSLGECVALDPEVLREAVRVLADVSVTDPVRTPGDLCVIEVAPGEAVDTQGIRGMFSARADPPMNERDRQAVREILAEIDG